MANKMMKKTLAILLTVIMVLSATQMVVFADGRLTEAGEEDEGVIVVDIPVIPARPVIPSNPIRPNIPDIPVIIVEEEEDISVEPQLPDVPAEDEEEPVEYDRPPRPRYQPQQDKEEISVEEIPVTDIPAAEPAEEFIEAPAEEIVEEIVEEIPEEEVPLADVPVTGDGMVLYTALTLLSGTGLAWLGLKKRH